MRSPGQAAGDHKGFVPAGRKHLSFPPDPRLGAQPVRAPRSPEGLAVKGTGRPGSHAPRRTPVSLVSLTRRLPDGFLIALKGMEGALGALGDTSLCSSFVFGRSPRQSCPPPSPGPQGQEPCLTSLSRAPGKGRSVPPGQ